MARPYVVDLRVDQSHTEHSLKRFWEMAERKTRAKSGVDAVAILAILQSRKNSFPISTVVIEQYRPPIDKVVIGVSNLPLKVTISSRLQSCPLV